MVDRTVRSLAHLEESASTSRVLNLAQVHRQHGKERDYAERPFFRSAALNRAIILKHRLRHSEKELFPDGRSAATKVIIPIDNQDLRLGGRYVFVDQTNFDKILSDFFGQTWAANRSDLTLLRLIDQLPTLDPFLLREQLRRNGHDPARCYFDVSDADMARMIAFVEREIQKLVDLCYATGEPASGRKEGTRLVKKILSSAVDGETEPLRLTLRLEKADYQEGVFCWKGFLYYKWILRELMADVSRVSDAIVKIKPRGTADPETVVELNKTRAGLHKSIVRSLSAARATLKYYDDAFSGLLGGDPLAFRDFLLRAPSMFCELGERLGAISHIVSYWGFRFPSGRLPVVTSDELFDIVADFQASLAMTTTETGREAAPQTLVHSAGSRTRASAP